MFDSRAIISDFVAVLWSMIATLRCVAAIDVVVVDVVFVVVVQQLADVLMLLLLL